MAMAVLVPSSGSVCASFPQNQISVRTKTSRPAWILTRNQMSVSTKTSRPAWIRASSSGCPGTPFEKLTNKNRDYKYGFKQDLESFSIGKGLSEDKIRLISKLKNEPDWMLEFRLDSYRKFLKMAEPVWSDNQYPPINFQDICYYTAAKAEVVRDPEIVDELIDLLDLPLSQKKHLGSNLNLSMDLVYDNESLGTRFTNPDTKLILEKHGVIYCSMSDAIRLYPDLIREYLGSVVSNSDNYYAALNSAVFSGGTFIYIPKNCKCPILLSTHFRINSSDVGQFERTLIVADEDSSVEYFEGCTAVAHHSNQLHAAVVELYAAKGAKIEYTTIQNWYAGDSQGRGGIYNFVTKRGRCAGPASKISWIQVEVGAAITWKYPSVVLQGDDSVGEFCSVAVTADHQQADTGTKMIHIGKNTTSSIMSKGISCGDSSNVYRGLVQIMSGATNARNFSQCDSMLIGDRAAANTYPYIQVRNNSATVEHEASTSRIGVEQIFYFNQRGMDQEQAISALINKFTSDVVSRLPQEFSVEGADLLRTKLDKSIG